MTGVVRCTEDAINVIFDLATDAIDNLGMTIIKEAAGVINLHLLVGDASNFSGQLDEIEVAQHNKLAVKEIHRIVFEQSTI